MFIAYNSLVLVLPPKIVHIIGLSLAPAISGLFTCLENKLDCHNWQVTFFHTCALKEITFGKQYTQEGSVP